MASGSSTLGSVVVSGFDWQGKRVFMTGHTGFKGAWLAYWLHLLGAEVTGYARVPQAVDNLYDILALDQLITSVIGDVTTPDPLMQAMQAAQPEVIFHLAAQSLVRYSYHHPHETYETNVMGTLNVLEAARHIDTVKAIVVVTSDKCYENKELCRPYQETDPMGGYDPYSSSKGCTELLVSAYRQSYFQTPHRAVVASARAGNVIGGGDFATDRLIPDLIKALRTQHVIDIRHPNAVRPWQHVLEPLSGYLCLAEGLLEQGKTHARAWNFGPRISAAKSVQWVVETFNQALGDVLRWQQVSGDGLHEAHYLALDSSQAENLLQWQARWSLERALTETAIWYQAYLKGGDMRALTLKQIQRYSGVIEHE